MSGRYIVALAALVALGATPVKAQETQQQPLDAEQVQAWFTEAQQIGQRLTGIQQEALSDPELAGERDQLGERIEAAMHQADPELGQTLERAPALQAELAQAQQAGDSARVEVLATQLQGLQQRYQRAQEQAMADTELAQDVLAFNERVERRMIEVDPETPQLIERLQALQVRLQGGTP